MKTTLIILALTILFFLPTKLLAKKVDAEDRVIDSSETEAEVDIHAVPPILDPAYRHRKRGQVEISPYGGAYLGNTVGQTWMAGARGYYHFNNTFAFGGSWGISKLLTNRSSSFGQNLTDNIMQIADAELMISNDAALRIGDSLLEMDFYATLGVGGMYLNGRWEPMGVIGGGIKFYTGVPWLALRIDVNSYAHNTSQPGKDVVDFDVVFLGGISFLFPSKPSPYER